MPSTYLVRTLFCSRARGRASTARVQTWALAGPLLVFLALAGTARAQGREHLSVSPYDLSALGGIGIMKQGDGLAVLVEPQLSFRYSFLTAGIGARLGAYKGAASSVGGWARAGFALALQHARFELVGLTGFNAYYELEAEPMLLGSSDPGFDVQLPFAGARLTGGGLINTRRLDVSTLAFERDLQHGYRSYTYTESYLFGDDEDVSVRHSYGWTRLGAFVQGGVVWPGARRGH